MNHSAPAVVPPVVLDPPAVGIICDETAARVAIENALSAQKDLTPIRYTSIAQAGKSQRPCGVFIVHCDALSQDRLLALSEFKESRPDVPLLAVCRDLDYRAARRALDRGLNGLVLAEDVDRVLGPSTVAVLAGQVVFPQSLHPRNRKPTLTFREKQILGMVVLGFSNGEIGSRLFLAESTVKSHLSSAFAKLGVRSRAEAAALITDPTQALGIGILALTPADWNSPAVGSLTPE